MTAADPLMLLDRALGALDTGEALSADVRHWLASGLRGMLAGARLEVALGLVRNGAPPISRRVAQVRADLLMCVALRAVPVTDFGASLWERCEAFAPLLRRYVQGAWRVDRFLDDPPRGAETWKAWAWHSMQFRDDPPLTAQGLWTLAKRAHRRQLEGLPHTLLAHLMSQTCPNPPNASTSSAPSAPT